MPSGAATVSLCADAGVYDDQGENTRQQDGSMHDPNDKEAVLRELERLRDLFENDDTLG